MKIEWFQADPDDEFWGVIPKWYADVECWEGGCVQCDCPIRSLTRETFREVMLSHLHTAHPEVWKS